MNGENVKISLKQIMIAIPIIKKMISVYLPVQASYWIKRNTDNMVGKLKKLEEDRNNLIRKYGLKDEATGNIVVDKTNELYWADYNLLLEEIVEVTINKVPVSDLKKTELSMQDIAAIEFMLRDSDDKIVVANNLIV